MFSVSIIFSKSPVYLPISFLTILSYTSDLPSGIIFLLSEVCSSDIPLMMVY